MSLDVEAGLVMKQQLTVHNRWLTVNGPVPIPASIPTLQAESTAPSKPDPDRIRNSLTDCRHSAGVDRSRLRVKALVALGDMPPQLGRDGIAPP